MTFVLTRPVHTFTREESDNETFRKPMKNESNRLQSYINWPVPFLRPEVLAKAGFYYYQVEDLVRCAFCGVELSNWEKGDNPMDDHKKWAMSCPFVNGTQCGNISMSSSSSTDDNNSSSNNECSTNNDGFDTCGKYGIQIRPNCLAETHSGGGDHLSQYMIQLKKAAHPQYATLDERLKSFKEWPVSLKQKPDELANAGFFYTGKGDQTICFYCGGGLKNWEKDDIAWEQHARWFSKCSFLRLHKSQEFIAKIATEHKAVLTAGEAEALVTVPNKPSTSTTTTTTTETSTTSSESSNKESSSVVVEQVESTKEDVPKPTMCKICWAKEVGVVFLPCGHMVSCVDCAPALSKCAVCRRELEATVRAFLS